MHAAFRGVDKIYPTQTAFAAVLKVGTMVTWVCQDIGGISNPVKAVVRVDKIYPTTTAFGAVLEVGTVVTWVCRTSVESLIRTGSGESC